MRHRTITWRLGAIGLLLLVLSPSVSSAAATGLRKVVAVSRFENATNYSGQVAINDAMADQLTDALIQSGQFTVVERQTLGDILAEEDFANSGRVQKAQTAKTGKLVAAQILIKGTITEYSSASSGSGKRIGFGGVSFGGGKSEAHVGLIIRLIDSSSGEILDSQRVEGKAKSSSSGFGVNLGGVKFKQDQKNSTPMGKATQVAIDNAVALIAERLAAIPFETRVIRKIGDELVIAAGAKVGAAVGQKFTVFNLGEEFIDPYTGESLGREEEKVGIVEIKQVKDRYSKAVAIGSLGTVVPGDIVRAH